jgi:hypothetical protein
MRFPWCFRAFHGVYAFFMPSPRNDDAMRHNLIFRNHVENDSHIKSLRTLIEHEPNLICPGHGRPYPGDRSILLATEDRMKRQQQLFVGLPASPRR